MTVLLGTWAFKENLVKKMLEGISDRTGRKVQEESRKETSKRSGKYTSPSITRDTVNDLNKLAEIRDQEVKSHNSVNFSILLHQFFKINRTYRALSF